jgi:prepilin peptidase CpaA
LTYADGGVALAVLAVGFLCFRLGWMGGGDAKLLAVLSLWAGSQGTVSFLLLTGLAGGGLAIALLGLRQTAWLWEPRMQQVLGFQQLPRLLQQGAPLPYGLAIVAGFVKTMHAGMVPGLSWPF